MHNDFSKLCLSDFRDRPPATLQCRPGRSFVWKSIGKWRAKCLRRRESVERGAESEGNRRAKAQDRGSPEAAAATASQMLSSYSVTCCGIEALRLWRAAVLRQSVRKSRLIGMNVGVVVDGRWQRGPVEVNRR